MSRSARVRRVNISLGGLAPMGTGQLSLFDDRAALEREEGLARAEVLVRSRFGPNALLRATSLMPEANSRERNLQVGGTVRDRGGSGELLADLPVPSDWSGLSLPELERRATLLAEIRRRFEEDGPGRASTDPGRGHLFIPFAALRGV